MMQLYLAQQRLEALLEMLEDDGAVEPGAVDPRHITALRNAGDGEAREVAKAHREGRDPPEVSRDR